MTALPAVAPAVHIEVLEQVARGSQLPGIADRLGLHLGTVRVLAARAGAPDLGEVRHTVDRLIAAAAVVS